MNLHPVPHPGLGSGLNLRDAPADVLPDQALDTLNCVFTERGAVRKREGTALFTAAALTNSADSLAAFYKVDSTKQLVVGDGNRLEVLDTSGASVASTTLPTASPHYFTRFGGPTIEAVYCANGTDQIRRYDTAGGFTSPAGLSGQTGKFLTVTPWDNRLVSAREGGSTGGNNPSSVNFSNVGDPETFDADDWEDLAPGDGEEIMGVCAWGDYVFAFKRTKFFAFYGTTVDSGTGDDSWPHRMIAGAGLACSGGLAVAPEGVYFVDKRGVYRTTGGPPELVSDQVGPIFDGNVNIYFQSQPLNHASIDKCKLRWHNRQLYLAYPSGVEPENDRVLVFDPQHGWWGIWDLPISTMASFRVGDFDELLFGYSDGTKHLGRYKGRGSGYLNDTMGTDGLGGTAIDSKWRSGWFDLKAYAGKKHNRSRMLWGHGTAVVETSVDYQTTPVSTATVTMTSGADLWGDGSDPSDVWGDLSDPTDIWGPAVTISQASDTNGMDGTVFSIQISNDELDETFEVHRLIHHISGPTRRPEAF